MDPLKYELKAAGACSQARRWASKFKRREDAWAKCRRPDWMIWAMEAADSPRRLVLTAVCEAVLATPINPAWGEGRTIIAELGRFGPIGPGTARYRELGDRLRLVSGPGMWLLYYAAGVSTVPLSGMIESVLSNSLGSRLRTSREMADAIRRVMPNPPGRLRRGVL